MTPPQFPRPPSRLAAFLLTLLLLAACGGGISGSHEPAGGGANGTAATGGTNGAAGTGGGAATGGGNGGAGGGGANDPCSPGATSLRRLWRLTPTQYDNTIRDLLGLTGTWGDTFPADTVVLAFANNGDALTVSPLLADKLRDAAEDIANHVELGALAPCAASQTDAACMTEVIRTVGTRAFRRPLAQTDIDRYAALAATEVTFEAGARLVVTALLQSPHFVYRRELGSADPSAAGRYLLDDYEVASELSYLLWQTMPDDTLRSAAEASELHTQEQIEAAALRMLADDKARPVVRAFVLEWLGLDAIPNVPKDPGRFPELTAELRASMLGEIDRFIDHVMFAGDGSLSALLTSPDTFLDARLAELYGATMGSDADAEGFALTQVQGQERKGILTLGGVMMRHGRSNDSSPVHRGRLVRERLLCQVPPPPPPGIVVQPPAEDPTKTARERYAAHSQEQPCKGCHVLMDPIGFAFERFDGIGRYRAMENGQAIDVTGEINSTDATDTTFEGTEQLADVLAASPDVSACMARQWIRFAYGLTETRAGRCATDPLVDALAGGGVTLERLVRVSAGGEPMRVRISANDAPAAQPDAGLPAGDGDGDGDGDTDPPQPDAAVEQPSGDIAFERVIDDDFTTGYCAQYDVTNNGTMPQAWSIALDLGGTLSQHWESLVDGQTGVTGVTGTVTFTGVTHNATLSAGATTRFGFCVMR